MQSRITPQSATRPSTVQFFKSRALLRVGQSDVMRFFTDRVSSVAIRSVEIQNRGVVGLARFFRDFVRVFEIPLDATVHDENVGDRERRADGGDDVIDEFSRVHV